MKFGIYVHIPYCLQRCSYCDFATYVHDEILPPHQYIELLKSEMRQRAKSQLVSQGDSANTLSRREVDTVYFGGGTPSLLEPEHIVAVLRELENLGFARRPDAEVTIEINPATITADKMATYLQAGINRFSVGAQTFDDALLKSVRREHDAMQTLETLHLLQSFNVNYSVDVLFSLPTQTKDGLWRDMQTVLQQRPHHVSPYCLTVPEGHALNKNRPLEGEQIDMFKLIHSSLTEAGYLRYEISNYCLPGFHSRHNSIYWSDDPYWGLGLSAHSYSKSAGDWGVRHWNPNSIGAYTRLIQNNQGQQWLTPYAGLSESHREFLKAHEAFTDYCHISLRRSEGLALDRLVEKFGQRSLKLIEGPLAQMQSEGLLRQDQKTWSLTDEGIFISNSVFKQLTILPEEWAVL